MGQAIGSLGGNLGGAGGLKDYLGQVGRILSGEGSQLGGVIQQILGSLNSTLAQCEGLKQGLGGAGAGSEGILRSFQSDLTRLAYIAALQKALKKAGGTGPFNVETAINDLWVSLDGVRKGSQAASSNLQGQMQKTSELMEQMSKMLKQMHDSSMAAIRNLR